MSGNEPVRVSVVVPVRNRRDLLALLLDGLDRQSFSDFEVVVVDDGSTDGAAEMAAGRRIRGRPVRVLRSTGGAVAARTAGVRAALGEILAFTDSDCVPDPEWLEAGVRALDDGADLVNGWTVPARRPGPLERSMGSGTEGLYPTANMFFRRAAYEAVGGFDQSADRRLGFRHDRLARGTGFGEDTILAWRMIRRGYRADFERRALVRHHVFEPDVEESLRRAWQMGAFPALVREVPELRETIVRRRVLFGVRSRLPAYATAAALLLRRPSLSTLALVWWATVRWRDMHGAPWPRRLAYLPVEMAVDSVSGAAMLLGSIRAGTIAL